MSGRDAMERRIREIGIGKKDTIRFWPPSVQMWDSSLKPFSQEIENYYNENKQPREELEEKLAILEEIEEYLEENVFNKPIRGIQYELKAVVPFGSSAGALGMKGGDLDMILCVYPPVDPSHEDLIAARTNSILKRIFKKIESGDMMEDREWEEMEHVDKARVPIITGSVDGIDIDISISMTSGVSAQYLAAKYIDTYAKYDRRFILLAAFIKAWQKNMKTVENEKLYSRVFPKSCCVVLMVVLFMKHYGMLPNVNKKHEDKLSEIRATWERVNGGEEGSFGVENNAVRDWKLSNKNDISLGTLFLLFIDFYTRVVDFKTDKLVVEDGLFVRKNLNERKDQIVIEDVLDKNNVGQSVTEVQRYRELLFRARETMKNCQPQNIFKRLMGIELRMTAEDVRKLQHLRY